MEESRSLDVSLSGLPGFAAGLACSCAGGTGLYTGATGYWVEIPDPETTFPTLQTSDGAPTPAPSGIPTNG